MMLSLDATQIAIAAVLVSALLCQWISFRRGNRSLLWACLGLLLGPIVVPFALLLAGKSKRNTSRHPLHSGSVNPL